MTIDVKNIGAFGVSFSRGMDQTWVNMYRREQGFLVEFFQNFEDRESDEDDEELPYDGVLYDVTCPGCGENITFDEETLDKGSIRCPNCGETLEFDLGDNE